MLQLTSCSVRYLIARPALLVRCLRWKYCNVSHVPYSFQANNKGVYVRNGAVGHITDAIHQRPGEELTKHEGQENAKRMLKAVLIGHSFVDHLRNHLRKETGNPQLDEFSEALGMPNSITVDGVKTPVSFQVTLFSIPDARLVSSSDMARLLDFVKQERPDLVAVEIGTHDLASLCPEDTGENPTSWSKDHMDVLLGKIQEFHQHALQYSAAVVFCKVAMRWEYNDDLQQDKFITRREYYNTALTALAESEPKMLARETYKEFCPEWCRDGIHLTSFKGLEHYRKFIRGTFAILARNVIFKDESVNQITDTTRGRELSKHQKHENAETILTAVLIGHSFVDRLRNYLRDKTGNPHLDEFAEALYLPNNLAIDGVQIPVSFRVTFFSIPDARLNNPSDMAHLLDYVNQERPDLVGVEIGTHDLASLCPDDIGANPTPWSKGHMDVLLGKIQEFHQHALQFCSEIGFCNIASRQACNDGIQKGKFKRRQRYYNQELLALEKGGSKMLAWKHRHIYFRDSWTSDGIHLTSNDALDCYRNSIKSMFLILARRLDFKDKSRKPKGEHHRRWMLTAFLDFAHLSHVTTLDRDPQSSRYSGVVSSPGQVQSDVSMEGIQGTPRVKRVADEMTDKLEIEDGTVYIYDEETGYLYHYVKQEMELQPIQVEKASMQEAFNKKAVIKQGDAYYY